MTMNIADHVAMLQQREVAPLLVQKVASEEDIDDLSQVCAVVEATVREECQERDLTKHAGIAACYMVVNRLSNPGEADDE